MSYIKKRKSAFGFAFKGIFLFFKEEAHAKIHLIIFLIVLFAGIYFELSGVEWVIILIASALVFSTEMLNSALERTIDYLHPEQHESIGKAKDIAAGAVLIAAIFAVAIGVVVFWPYLRT